MGYNHGERDGMSFLSTGIMCNGPLSVPPVVRAVTSNCAILPIKGKYMFAFSVDMKDNLVFLRSEILMKTVFLQIMLTSKQV